MLDREEFLMLRDLFIRNDNHPDFEIYILPCSSNTNSAAQLSTSLFRSDSMAKEIAQHAEVL